MSGLPDVAPVPPVTSVTSVTSGAAKSRMVPAALAATGSGWVMLIYKELLRFWKVAFQTILAPIVTSLLYLLIFSHALSGNVRVYEGRVDYTAFLIPGLVMMSVLQNAFANSSSSIIQSKVTGNLIFILLPPLSPIEIYGAYVVAAMIRGLVVGSGVFLVTLWFAPSGFLAAFPHPWWTLAFAALGSAILGTLGLIAGIWADKFDQLAAFQNFVILPLTFLSGVFYSIHSLPPFWQGISHFNPFFYMIDGFRYGFFGLSDVPPLNSLAVVGTFALALSLVSLFLLKRGYKLRQ